MNEFHVGDRVTPIPEGHPWVGVVTRILSADHIEVRDEKDELHVTSVYVASKFRIVQKNIYMEDTRAYIEAISDA